MRITRATQLLAACLLVADASACGPAAPAHEDSGAGDSSTDGPAVDLGDRDAAQTSACGVVGTTRAQPCAFCGQGTATCTAAGTWVLTACTGLGECEAGTVDVRHDVDCSSRSRTCSSSCTWEAWIAGDPPAAAPTCEYGTGLLTADACPGNQVTYQRCNPTTCTPETVHSACGGGCPGDASRRTSPDYKEEICIPRGTVTRDHYSEDKTVTTSAYFIDRYPVTYRRYQECVDSGSCTALATFVDYFGAGLPLVDSPTHPDAPVWSATRDQARMFCQWDGGRRLPRWFEVIRYVAGEEDLTVPVVTGTSSPKYSLLSGCYQDPTRSMCTSTQDMNVVGRVYEDYDAHPMAQHHWGVELAFVHFPEWINDRRNEPQWPYAYETLDPEGPTTSYPAAGAFSVSGSTYHLLRMFPNQRYSYSLTQSGGDWGIQRCTIAEPYAPDAGGCPGTRGVAAIRCVRTADGL